MSRKILKNVLLTGLIYLLSLLILASCESQAPISDATGNIQVLIPVVGEDNNKLSTVTLKNIANLSQVSGSYAQFYYTPGAEVGKLTGGAPQARFIRTSDGVFVPADILTQQMFSIYYHVQKLTDFNTEVSPELKPSAPFQVGLNTQVKGGSVNGVNNAFYDGQSNALLFVPYNLKGMPITVNGGIIAHEFFHSLFYKKLLGDFNAQQKALVEQQDSSSDAMKAFYFNETYIRGLNEGLADFWGWMYTSNIDYISISLPQFGEARKMELDAAAEGRIETSEDIANMVNEAQAISRNPSEYLSGYIYRIGTPHARFLRTLTVRLSRDSGEDLEVTKLKVGQSVYHYLKNVSAATSAFTTEQVFAADDLFSYMAQPDLSGLKLSAEQCDFVLKYIDVKGKNEAQKKTLCQGTTSNE